MEQVHRHPRPGRLPCRPLAQVQPVTWTWPSPGRAVLAAANAGLGRLCPLGQGPGPQRPSGCLPPHTQQAGGPSPQSPAPWGQERGPEAAGARGSFVLGKADPDKPRKAAAARAEGPGSRGPLVSSERRGPGWCSFGVGTGGGGRPGNRPTRGPAALQVASGNHGKGQAGGRRDPGPGCPVLVPPTPCPEGGRRPAWGQPGPADVLPAATASVRSPRTRGPGQGSGGHGSAAWGAGVWGPGAETRRTALRCKRGA